MLASSGDPPPPPCVRWMAGRDAGGVDQFWSTVWCLRLTTSLYPTGRRLLLVLVHLRFVNVDSRPIRVRRASQVPQGRVPRGVHGKAR